MNGLPYYKAYPRDFIEGTVGMDFETKGAYRLVLDLIYMQGGKLPDDARYIAGLLGCSVKRWMPIRKRLLDMGKLVASGGYLGNLRADKELDSLKSYSTSQRENRLGKRKIKGLPETTVKPNDNHTEPDTKERDAKASPKKTGCRLPDGWVLPKEWGDWAVAEGWPDVAVRDQAARFKDYWISKTGRDATKADWLATWRNWMRNSKTPKIVSGGKYERTSANADRLNAFIAGARGAS